jgi:hypothetical protein
VEIDENGVVNPLRPPRIVAAAGARFAGLPPLALGFVVLALIDLVVGGRPRPCSEFGAGRRGPRDPPSGRRPLAPA